MKEEEVYILQPLGFEIKGKEHNVYKLLKALYGLKKASRAWNRLIDNFLGKQGFVKCTVEFGVYEKEIQHKNLLFVCLYVDDLIIIGDVNEEIEQFGLSFTLNTHLTANFPIWGAFINYFPKWGRF